MEKDLLLNEALEAGVETVGGLNLAKVAKIGVVVAGLGLVVVVAPKIVKKIKSKMASRKNLLTTPAEEE